MGTRVATSKDFTYKPKFTYQLEIGPVTQDKNLFASPSATGDVIDLATAEDELDFTSRVTLHHNFAPRHEWDAYIAPMELIEFDGAALVPEPLDFAGVTFTPTENSEFKSRYNFVEVKAQYRYALVNSERFRLALGGGIQYTDTYLGIEQYDAPVNSGGQLIEFAEAETRKFNAILSARLNYAFSPRWILHYELDGTLSEDEYVNTALSLDWRVAPEWTLGLGARYTTWKVEDEDVSNELQYGDLILKFSYSFL